MIKLLVICKPGPSFNVIVLDSTADTNERHDKAHHNKTSLADPKGNNTDNAETRKEKVKLVNRNVERGLRGSQEHLARELETDNDTAVKPRQIKTLFSFIGLKLKPPS